MDDKDLRDAIEQRMRDWIELGLERTNQSESTDEQKRARLELMLELMPESRRKVIEEHGLPERAPVSKAAIDGYIESEVDALLRIIIDARAKAGRSGPLTETEFEEAYANKPDSAANYMLFRLRSQPSHPLRNESIVWLEQSKRDIEVLRNSPTEEQIAEIQQRIEAQMQFNPEEFFKRAQELLDKESSDE